MGGSVGLIIGSSDGGSGDDFFFEWVCSDGVVLVALISGWIVYSSWVCSCDDFFLWFDGL